MSQSRGAVPPTRVRPLRAAAGVLLVEGAALLALAVVLVILGFTGQPEDRVGLLLQALLAALSGVLLGLSTRPLLRLRGWVRSPLVVAELVTLPVGVGLVQAHVWWAAVPVLVLPVAVLVLLATPAARTPFQELD